MANRNEMAQFDYAKWLPLYEHEKPFMILSNLKSGDGKYRTTNIELEKGELEDIRDVRGRQSNYTLDSHGFQFSSHPWTMATWYSKDAVENEYFPEIESLIRREIPGVKQTHIFDWRVCKLGSGPLQRY